VRRHPCAGPGRHRGVPHHFEASIGANMRRLEAITGHDTLALLRSRQSLIDDVARSLGVPAAELADGVAKRQGETKL